MKTQCLGLLLFQWVIGLSWNVVHLFHPASRASKVVASYVGKRFCKVDSSPLLLLRYAHFDKVFFLHWWSTIFGFHPLIDSEFLHSHDPKLKVFGVSLNPVVSSAFFFRLLELLLLFASCVLLVWVASITIVSSISFMLVSVGLLMMASCIVFLLLAIYWTQCFSMFWLVWKVVFLSPIFLRVQSSFVEEIKALICLVALFYYLGFASYDINFSY